jgi:hypothetical protein
VHNLKSLVELAHTLSRPLARPMEASAWK